MGKGAETEAEWRKWGKGRGGERRGRIVECLLEMKVTLFWMSGRSPRLADTEDSPQCNIQSVKSLQNRYY